MNGNVLISKKKYMLLVLKRTVSMRRSFEHTNYMLKLKDQKNISLTHKKFGQPDLSLILLR